MLLLRIIVTCLIFSGALYAQNKGHCHDVIGDSNFINSVIKTLDSSNILRYALESGKRGNCVRYTWMDEMNSLGIKQVSATVEFSWNGRDFIALRIKEIDYHPVYYQYNIVITDPSVLKNIEKAGLKKTIKPEIEKRARGLIKKILNKPLAAAGGTLYINLLDDERLPVMTDRPDIIYKN